MTRSFYESFTSNLYFGIVKLIVADGSIYRDVRFCFGTAGGGAASAGYVFCFMS